MLRRRKHESDPADFFLANLEERARTKTTKEPLFEKKEAPSPAVKAVPKKPRRAVRDPFEAKERAQKAAPIEPAPAPKEAKPVEPVPAPRETKPIEPAPKPKETKPIEPAPAPKEAKPIEPAPAPKEEKADLDAQLDGKFGVYREKEKNAKNKMTVREKASYVILFVCIFGFLFAGYFVCQKLYEYYESNKLYHDLQDMLSAPDLFEEDYLAKGNSASAALTISDTLNGKLSASLGSSGALNSAQQNILSKIGRLQAINPDTAGWITISGTVVNYPVVWTQTKDYYLRRDFYGKPQSSGTIYIDDRNDRDPSQNRNTVLYGHNMRDGSMFASLHDFSNRSVFYNSKIEIATENGIYIYTPFSVHESDAHDNYFETEFQNDSDFLDFCEEIAFLSLYEMEYEFTPSSQIITLSTCMDNFSATDGRWAVHAVLTQIIR